MTEFTWVGLTCRAFARAGSTGGSHDRAHTGSGSHAGHSSTSTRLLAVELLHCTGYSPSPTPITAGIWSIRPQSIPRRAKSIRPPGQVNSSPGQTIRLPGQDDSSPARGLLGIVMRVLVQIKNPSQSSNS